MRSTEIVKSYIGKYPSLSDRALAKVIFDDHPGQWSTPGSVRTLLQTVKKRGNIPTPATHTPLFTPNTPPPTNTPVPNAPPPETALNPLSELELRNAFDIRVIVHNALKTLVEGEFWPEQDFIRKHGLATRPGFRGALESDYTKPYKGKAQGKIFYSHPRSIDKLKQEGVLL